MKKIIIEIVYEEERDIFFHLSIIRSQLKHILKNKDLIEDSVFEQQANQSGHKIILKNS